MGPAWPDGKQPEPPEVIPIIDDDSCDGGDLTASGTAANPFRGAPKKRFWSHVHETKRDSANGKVWGTCAHPGCQHRYSPKRWTLNST